MKIKLPEAKRPASSTLTIICITLFLLVLFSYPESVVIMRGDYLLTRWVSTIETNKNWFMLFFWVIVGGTIPYIIWKLPKILKNRKNK